MRHIREKLRRDDGISLAELIVSMALGVLLLTIIGGFFISVVRGSSASASADVNTRQESNAINTMVQYFHAATTYPVSTQTSPLPAFASAGATDVTFYAYVNLVSTAAQPVKVRYYVDPTSHNLIEQQWSSTCSTSTGYCTFSSTVTTQIILGGPIASPTSDAKPLFSYLDATQTPTTTLSSIDYVVINLELGSTTPGTSGDAHVTTTVGLLNLGQSGASS